MQMPFKCLVTVLLLYFDESPMKSSSCQISSNDSCLMLKAWKSIGISKSILGKSKEYMHRIKRAQNIKSPFNVGYAYPSVSMDHGKCGKVTTSVLRKLGKNIILLFILRSLFHWITRTFSKLVDFYLTFAIN